MAIVRAERIDGTGRTASDMRRVRRKVAFPHPLD
jgi:hypothetical protein